MFFRIFIISLLVVFIAGILFFDKMMLSIHRFLEITSPINAQILVVDGWLTSFDYTLPEAVKEFEDGSYEYIVAVSVAGKSKSRAEKCAEKIQSLGVDSEKIRVVTAPALKKYKTYGTAIALRDWLIKEHPDIQAVNVFTGGTHGRKTYYLFKKALKNRCDVGIISSHLRHTPMGKWWKTNRGFVGTWFYFIGYIYTFIKPTWPDDLKSLYENDLTFRPNNQFTLQELLA